MILPGGSAKSRCFPDCYVCCEVEEPSGDLVTPGEMDSYTVIGIFNYAFESGDH